MGKFKKPEGGFYTEEEVKIMRGEPVKRKESGGITTENLHKVIVKEKPDEKTEKKPTPKTDGAKRKVGTKKVRRKTTKS